MEKSPLKPKKPLIKSGYHYPNKLARIYLEAIEEIAGRNGLSALLNLAEIPQFMQHRPPDNMEKSFDFAYLTAIQVAFEEMGGPKMGGGLARRASKQAFNFGIENFRKQLSFGDIQSPNIPLEDKLAVGLPMMAEFLMKFSDQVSRAYPLDEKRFAYTLERCPLCWHRQSEYPVCHTAQGLIEEGLYWLTNGTEFKVEMVNCIAVGDEMGKIVIYHEPTN